MRPPPGELERRRLVWATLSEFFLDAQLDATDRERIAGVLASSGYSIKELDRILWRELCPVLWVNLRCVAGEWAGFDMAEVEKRILSHPAGIIRRWWSYTSGGKIARHDWERVRAVIESVTSCYRGD